MDGTPIKPVHIVIVLIPYYPLIMDGVSDNF